MPIWTQIEALKLCKEIEVFAPLYGFHVALTGGLLYKSGPRKDADILFYHVGKVAPMDVDGLIFELEKIGFHAVNRRPFHCKASYKCKPVDIMFPQIENLEDCRNTG